MFPDKRMEASDFPGREMITKITGGSIKCETQRDDS